MSHEWPLVPLGQLLNQVAEAQPVSADQDYPNFGIYSFGRGLFPKPPISGTATSAETLFLSRKGRFIYSRLFAFEGAYGLITEEFDEHYVSNEYPMFECDQERLYPPYLERYFKSPTVWAEVARLSTGLGHRRRRIQPEQFLTHRIPLPPVVEQRRIVAEISKLEEAQRLHAEVGKELEALYHTVLRRAFQGGF